MTVALNDNGLRKAAILLVQLGQDKAAKILSHLREREVELLSAEIADLQMLSADETDSVIHEFHQITSARANILNGGPDFARAMLEESLGREKADSIMNRLHMAARQMPFQFLHRADARQLLSFISGEHPQLIAVILAHMPSDRATLVLSGLEPERQAEVAHRIAVMDRTSPEVVRELEVALERKTSSVLQPQDFSTVGGLDPLIEMMNRADRGTERLIIESLEKRDPALAEEVKSRMFMFEDLIHLDNKDMQFVLRQVEIAELALALKGVSGDVKDKIMANMSQRASENLLEEVELLGPVLLRQVEEAQASIIRNVRRLEESGEITLRRNAEDEYVE